MKKKRRILFAAILLGVVGGVLWTSARGQKAIVVYGDLSPREVAEINGVVKANMRKQVWPKFSWATIKALPANVKWYFRHDVRSIALVATEHAYVAISKPKDDEMSTRDIYEVIKGTNGWKVGNTITMDNNFDLINIDRAH